jgi:hypothetical protein
MLHSLRLLSLRLATVVAVCATPALAAPTTCGTASAAVYADLPEGCTVGLFTLKNVAWSSVSGEGYVAVNASDVIVSPMMAGSDVRVAFYSTAFSVTGFNRILGFFDYTLDPPPPILDDLNLSLDANSPVAPGYAIITANVCPGELFRQGCRTALPPLVLQHFGAGNPNNVLSRSIQFPQPVNLIDVRITVDLNANGGSSQINGVVADAGTTVPEPSTGMMLAGAGAAVLGWVRRRQKL